MFEEILETKTQIIAVAIATSDEKGQAISGPKMVLISSISHEYGSIQNPTKSVHRFNIIFTAILHVP